MKTHDLKTVVVGALLSISYFYIREKNDKNGNPKYRVFIIDPEGPAVYEKLFTSYNIESDIKNYIENMGA